jgi:UDP-N-acetylmuramoyl-tripeptide--D-alanyl-D-alanine ligase
MIGEFTLSELASELGLSVTLSALKKDAAFSAVTTDSRNMSAGDLYVALKGERFNGDEFVEEALTKGAVAAVTHQSDAQADAQRLVVDDTLSALATLARLNRDRSSAKVIALTGSQGKTSVKEMIGSILKAKAPTLITAENLNNTIGVPLTLLRLEARHEFAVIEMGANGAGEIAVSVAATKPDIALITKASAAHIEGFGSLQGIVLAKGEIIDGLSDKGVAVLNANDPNCQQWVKRAGQRQVRLFSYGNKVPEADYRCSATRLLAGGSVAFTLYTPQGEIDAEIQLLGSHNAENALSAAACALEAGASLDDVRIGLKQATPVPGRLFPSIGREGCRLLDDTYNANPDSFHAAIDVLMAAEGEKVMVAGEMRELGDETESSHREVGEYAARHGVPLLLALGSDCAAMVEAYLEAGGLRAKHYSDREALEKDCVDLANSETVFLVKGSRGARMETVVAALSAAG